MLLITPLVIRRTTLSRIRPNGSFNNIQTPRRGFSSQGNGGGTVMAKQVAMFGVAGLAAYGITQMLSRQMMSEDEDLDDGVAGEVVMLSLERMR